MSAESIVSENIVELDVRGQICPSCMIIALKQVNLLEKELKHSSKELHILTDNRQLTSTIPEAVIKMGYQIGIARETEGYRIRIRYPRKARLTG